MTITAMVILERCRTAGREMRLLWERVARYQDAIGRMTSTLGSVGSRGTGETDRIAAMLGEIDELERRAEMRKKEYDAEVAATCKLLDMLPDVESAILSRFYVKRLPLKAIARELGYSYGYVRTCKSEGCKHLDDMPGSVILDLLPPSYITDDEKRQR